MKTLKILSVVSLLGFLVVPGVSSAQTVQTAQIANTSATTNGTIQAQLQAQLQSLLQELEQLEALVALMQNSSNQTTVATAGSVPAAATITVIPTAPIETSASGFSFAFSPLGQSSDRIKSATDPFAALSFAGSESSANGGGNSIAINQINITFSGAAADASLLQAGAVRLLDENNQPLGLAVTTSTSGNNYVWSFDLGSGTSADAQGIISAGGNETWTLVVNDFDLAQASGENSVNLVATINANSDIQYTDGLSNTATTGLMLPSSVLTPIELNSVVFAPGT